MSFYVPFAIGNEPHIRVRLECENHDLHFDASYENDKGDKMELDSPATQLPCKSELMMNFHLESEVLHVVNPAIKADVIGVLAVLEKTVTSPEAVMKTAKIVDWYLWEKDPNSIKCVPDREKLWISNGRLTFRYPESNPGAHTDISEDELNRINRLIGANPKRAWLISILWYLAEYSLNLFGKGRL